MIVLDAFSAVSEDCAPVSVRWHDENRSASLALQEHRVPSAKELRSDVLHPSARGYLISLKSISQTAHLLPTAVAHNCYLGMDTRGSDTT